MPRKKLEPGEKLTPVGALVKEKIFDIIERLDCKEIAENAINKEYEKQLKKQLKCTQTNK